MSRALLGSPGDSMLGWWTHQRAAPRACMRKMSSVVCSILWVIRVCVFVYAYDHPCIRSCEWHQWSPMQVGQCVTSIIMNLWVGACCLKSAGLQPVNVLIIEQICWLSFVNNHWQKTWESRINGNLTLPLNLKGAFLNCSVFQTNQKDICPIIIRCYY